MHTTNRPAVMATPSLRELNKEARRKNNGRAPQVLMPYRAPVPQEMRRTLPPSINFPRQKTFDLFSYPLESTIKRLIGTQIARRLSSRTQITSPATLIHGQQAQVSTDRSTIAPCPKVYICIVAGTLATALASDRGGSCVPQLPYSIWP